jgi:threonine aldolase
VAETPGVVDLRSDTVTTPTPGMRRAMAEADVGDDVYGEDPTINALEDEVAALFGHEAALFVPSGTMGNQIALRTLISPGSELICDADAHVVTYEYGAAAAHGGISTRTWPTQRGLLDVDTVTSMVRSGRWHDVATRAIAVENTHNRGGGTVQPLDRLRLLRARAGELGVSVHCDGARIWNAHVASGVPLAQYGGLFDTLSVCLSKGLGAPVGSLMVSSEARIAEARTMRKRLGGGMRQAGVLAAAGRYALEHHLRRLADDHEHARLLAGAAGADPSTVDTNIVLVDVDDAPAVADKAKGEGVLISPVGPRQLRLVTHLGVDRSAVDRAAEVLARLVAAA